MKTEPRTLVLFLLLVCSFSVASGQAVKELPRCKPGYDYQLVDHQFVCTKTPPTQPSSQKRPSINERLDDLETASDTLVPKLNKVIALCERAQIWSTIDNTHPDAVKTRQEIDSAVFEVKMRLAVFDISVEVVKDEKMNVEQTKRYLAVMDEVTPLLKEMRRQLQRCEASQ